MMMMSFRMIHDDGPVVSSGPNEVVVTGPETVDVSLTPRAAVQAAEELLVEAAEALGKKAFVDGLGMRLKLQAAELRAIQL